MCCDGYDNTEEVVGECPVCGAPIDSDGFAVGNHCNYSPRCQTCGDAPCDGSC
jgi:hypothetical protein